MLTWFDEIVHTRPAQSPAGFMARSQSVIDHHSRAGFNEDRDAFTAATLDVLLAAQRRASARFDGAAAATLAP